MKKTLKEIKDREFFWTHYGNSVVKFTRYDELNDGESIYCQHNDPVSEKTTVTYFNDEQEVYDNEVEAIEDLIVTLKKNISNFREHANKTLIESARIEQAVKKNQNRLNALKNDNTTLEEKIAHNAASGWCRCWKCDEIINDTGQECDKRKLRTCHQWYDGYRTALLALADHRIKDLKGQNL